MTLYNPNFVKSFIVKIMSKNAITSGESAMKTTNKSTFITIDTKFYTRRFISTYVGTKSM